MDSVSQVSLSFAGSWGGERIKRNMPQYEGFFFFKLSEYKSRTCSIKRNSDKWCKGGNKKKSPIIPPPNDSPDVTFVYFSRYYFLCMQTYVFTRVKIVNERVVLTFSLPLPTEENLELACSVFPHFSLLERGRINTC